MIVCVVLAGIGAGCSSPAPTRPHVSGSASALAGWRSFPWYRDAVPVLTYHGIGGKPSHLTVSHAQFLSQMAALAAGGFHTLTMGQYLRFVRGDSKGLPSRAMTASGTWDVEEHFGYGHEYVPVNAAGRHGAVFGDLAFQPGRGGAAGHLETFAQFRARLAQNMRWGEAQLRSHLPSFQPLAMGLPQGSYGQGPSNSPLIAPFVLAWMRRHFGVVFGGDYLAGTLTEAHRVPGRFSRRLSYRFTMGALETLPVLRCRLLAWIHNRPIGSEYHCLRLAGPGASRAVNVAP